MGQINAGRVILGGLLAGLILNVGESLANMVVFAGEYEAMLDRFNLEPVGAGGIAVFVVGGFVLGILMVWLYAAMRPRFGPGPKTAVLVGLAVWFLAWFWQALGMLVMGLFGFQIFLLGEIWGVVEVVLAALAGGWVYREGEAAAAAG
ncbi:MAG: hypothetical protein GTN62_04920 [Gemmatimonadales bacterium]|nr:hypothetical protein [Gemmatimonadales bacterium]NIN10797.1 hypothetical protein [Gemmatimonadales bacterium]NIN49441.1 hypothetical protein [Gemmatimonadales bacterium]NIP06905.1 hypothetical protein [Gemmatimonadales bacterium]NIR02841.1 hypothetical protein [Gemmatimonadales bacterium]